MKKRRRLKIKRLILFLLLILSIGIGWFFLKEQNFFKSKPNDSEIEGKEPEEEKPKEYSLDMIMVGDVLIHSLVYRDAKVGDTYDFNPMFDRIRDIVGEYDLAFCNQETPFGGKELGYSGYPVFNTPSEIGDALIGMGFNLVSLATNHTMDKGVIGAINSLNYWNSKEEVLTAGSYLSEEARKEVRIREKNNIKYTMLAYLATFTNKALPSNQQYLLNMYDKEKVKEDIERVRDKVDLLIVSMHWGQEYKTEPNAKQREIAEYLASLGVDIIIGHHTHSVQPIEYIDGTLVFYSLGNFISNQPNYDDLIGLMPTLRVTKTVDKDKTTMQISDLQANLIYTYYEGVRCETCYHSNYSVIPFSEITANEFPQYKTYYNKYKDVLTSLDPTIKVGAINE